MSALTEAARRFRAAHHGPQPLVLPNVWDCASARVFAGAGFGALATSSGAVAATLGYADGQHTPAAESLAELAATGVARITFGSSLHQRATEDLAATARALREEEPGRARS